MSRITQYFQPPLYWQQFEDLTAGIFRYTYNDPSPQKIGRPGQSQFGVDVHGKFRSSAIGVQCKRMDELDENSHPIPGGTISHSFLDNAVKEAKTFPTHLDIWILATTAKRDAKIQFYAMQLDEASRSQGSFGIQLWFWDDFITDLNRHHDLQKWYYDQVIQIQSTDDQDKLILEMLKEAFARAAFSSPLHQESPAEFIDALKDTQCAINTGQLKDRETRRVIRQTVGGRQAVTNPVIGGYLADADKKIQELREVFYDSLDKDIHKAGCILHINPPLLNTLNTLRAAAIADMNSALTHAGLSKI